VDRGGGSELRRRDGVRGEGRTSMGKAEAGCVSVGVRSLGRGRRKGGAC